MKADAETGKGRATLAEVRKAVEAAGISSIGRARELLIEAESNPEPLLLEAARLHLAAAEMFAFVSAAIDVGRFFDSEIPASEDVTQPHDDERRAWVN